MNGMDLLVVLYDDGDLVIYSFWIFELIEGCYFNIVFDYFSVIFDGYILVGEVDDGLIYLFLFEIL